MADKKVQQYGTLPDGRQVMLYRLQNKAGTQVEITDFGGTIRSIRCADKNGALGDIALGHENLEDLLHKPGWRGCVIGRCINRIGKGELIIRGKRYELEKNAGAVTIHGASGGYGRKLFAGEYREDSGEARLTLYHHDKGEGGFPGEVEVWVTYILTESNELKIQYKALPTEETVLNISNHCYFNLRGHGSGYIGDQYMQIEADYFTPDGTDGLPTGEIRSTAGTVFDFSRPRILREGLESDDPQIRVQGGYDHNFCIRGSGFRKAAKAYDEQSGRVLSVYTDMPGMQLYCACNDPGGTGYKDGAEYKRYGAFCLETQYFPNAAAHSHFPSPIFPADKVFYSETVYAFGVE